MKKATLKYLATTTLFTPFLFIVAAEILLRVQGTYYTWTEKNQGKYRSPYQEPPSPRNSWYHIRTPNVASSYKQPEFDFDLITNSFGIRDSEPPVEKMPNEFRLIGLGDSYTEGEGAHHDSTYLKILERTLNGRIAGVHVKIICAGVAGSDPFYSYTLLRDKLLKFEPDLVTVAINNSDITDIITRGGQERFLADGKVRYNEPPMPEWLFASSHLYRFGMVRFWGKNWLGLSQAEYTVKSSEAVEKLKTAIAEFAALAKKEDFAFLVILHPNGWHEVFKQAYLFDANKLKGYMRDQNIRFVDVLEAFPGRVKLEETAIKKLYWEKDLHNNAKGYEIFAEGIAEYILDQKLIDSRRTNLALPAP